MNNQILVLKEGEVKFNLPLKLRKSFVVSANQDQKSEGNMPKNFKNLDLGQGRYFWGYANVEQVDMQGDLFPISTLQELAPGLTEPPYNKIFLFHNYEDIAIGTITATATDTRGLLILAKLNEDHVRAEEVWGSILNGSLDGFSMGGSFTEVESYYDEGMDMVVSVAKKAIVSEVSLTSIPVNGGSLLQGAFQKAKKKFTEKFGDPKTFMKGKQVLDLTTKKEGDDFQKPFAGYKDFKDCVDKNGNKSDPQAYCATIMRNVEKSEKRENFKYNKAHYKIMDISKLSKEQKSLFDKMVSNGKSKEDAYKEVMAQQKTEASESVNQDLTGNDSKKMKKSVEGESEETESQPESEEKVEEKEFEKKEVEGSEEKVESEVVKENKEVEEKESEEVDEKVDYKEEYEKTMKENKLLKEKLKGFEKSMKEPEESKEEKPVRKSTKVPEVQTPNPSNSTQAEDSSFMSWLKQN